MLFFFFPHDLAAIVKVYKTEATNNSAGLKALYVIHLCSLHFDSMSCKLALFH